MITLPPLTPARSADVSHLLDRVHHCDALDLLRALPDASVDMALTSPPYDNLRTYNGFTWDFEGIARETYRVLKPGGVLVWVVGDATVNGSETLTSMRQALYFVDVVGFKMHDTMIYEKDSFSYPESNRYSQVWEYAFVLAKNKLTTANLIQRPSAWAGHKHTVTKRDKQGKVIYSRSSVVNETTPLTNVWRFATGKNKTTIDDIKHPAPFPEDLARDHILTWSNPGDTVLDYFMGSGTTAKMARANGRHYIGCDISHEYVAIAHKRLAQSYTLPMFTEAV